MKPLATIVALVIVFLPLISFGQEQRTNTLTERKSIDWFYADANSQPKTLLLKVLQFTAPYPGYYQQTSLDTNGNALTARVVPDWAVQNSANAKLDDALLAQVRQMLAELNAAATPAGVEPQQGQLHSAVVFFNGHDFLRLNYNGPIPAQLEAILAILNKEFTAATQSKLDEVAAHQKSMRETYGDWQNGAGVTTNASVQMNSCKGNRALVVLTAGQRKTVATASPTGISVYHALILYPDAAVTGSGSGGRWGDDPVQSYVVTWTLPNANGSFSENTSQRKFEILNNAIDATVTIGGKTYQLVGGNMFVVRIGSDWLPTVTQLSDVFEEQATPQATLNRFKANLKDDAAVQKLELN